MKKNYFFIGLISASVLALSFEHSAKTEIGAYTKAHRNSGGAAAGNTGAPGESALACAQCHSGGTTDGTAENLLIVSDGANPVTEYIPGNVYTVSLGMASSPAKKGFQATALDPSNNMAGNFTSLAGVNVSGAARKYANHTNASNTSATIAWQWTWTAPATNVGDVTFYVASNRANNNGANSGDVIYLSQHVISVAANAGQAELDKNKNDFKAREDSNIGVLNCTNAGHARAADHPGERDAGLGRRRRRAPLLRQRPGQRSAHLDRGRAGAGAATERCRGFSGQHRAPDRDPCGRPHRGLRRQTQPDP